MTALVHGDRVEETSTTTGTGTYDLGGAASGKQTFVAGIGNGKGCYYVAAMGTDWEIGFGIVTDATPDTLSRKRILLSTNSNNAVNWGAGSKTIFCAPPAIRAKDIAPPKGHIWGLQLSNAADTQNDITVAAGECTDDTGEVVMKLTSSLTKQIDASWAVGDAAGGFNTGSVADGNWYEMHLIMREDTGVVDAMFTSTANRATLPTNYTHKRRIGWIRRLFAGAGNLQFFQAEDYFTFTSGSLNDIAATVTTTETSVALNVPPNTIARFRATATTNASINAGEAVVFKEVAAENGTAPDDTTGLGSLGLSDIVGAAAGHFELRVDGSSQISHDASATTGSPTIDSSTYGWIDRRERLQAL